MQELVLYGQKTSDSAKKLIIDLFNRINKDKPYIMKTITTIYKNDEIFNDNQRYPIDAPYRAFYKELTEDYVSKYGLDNIFFEKGKARVGNYYFEYDYRDNNFMVFSSPIEIDLETRRRYLPMLYSMVTGEKIDWENARVSFSKRNKESCEGEHKILLMFGKDSLKTLEFSWLATFEVDKQYEKDFQTISEDIRDQEEEILNFTQGVLFSKLDDVILEFDKIRELVKNSNHTIKNFGFKNHLTDLYVKLESKDFKGALDIFNYIESISIVRDITLNLLHNYSGKISDSLLYKDRYTSYSSILTLLFSTSLKQKENHLSIDDLLNQHPINNIDNLDLVDVFTVLLNLFLNIKRRPPFSINAVIEKHTDKSDTLKIIFWNTGAIKKPFKDYLLGKTYVNPSNGEGIRFILKSLANLPNCSIDCSTTATTTTTTLIIKNK